MNTAKILVLTATIALTAFFTVHFFPHLIIYPATASQEQNGLPKPPRQISTNNVSQLFLKKILPIYHKKYFRSNQNNDRVHNKQNDQKYDTIQSLEYTIKRNRSPWSFQTYFYLPGRQKSSKDTSRNQKNQNSRIKSTDSIHLFFFFHGDDDFFLERRINFFYIPESMRILREWGVLAGIVFPQSHQEKSFDTRWQSMNTKNFDRMAKHAINSLQKMHKLSEQDILSRMKLHLISFSGGLRPLPQILAGSALRRYIHSIIMLDSIYFRDQYLINFVNQNGHLYMITGGGEPQRRALKIKRRAKKKAQIIHIRKGPGRHYFICQDHLFPFLAAAAGIIQLR